MVSSEGACAAYYSYGRHKEVQPVPVAMPQTRTASALAAS
jgi:hypothetical protein